MRKTYKTKKWFKEDDHAEKKRQHLRKVSVKLPVHFDDLPLPQPLSFALIVPTSASEKGSSRPDLEC